MCKTVSGCVYRSHERVTDIMCGLVFLYNNALDSESLLSKGRNALASMIHRGPDDSGIQIDKPWVIGHRRLSIIDINASKQPMRDPSGRYVLAFNGEVYNYRELREDLEPHWQFETNGDTEVILAGLITHGEKFIRKMDGMWAISFWDAHDMSLLLSRDRMGKKPLYYQNKQPTFVCASELPSLLKMLDESPVEDLNSTADYFRYGYFLPGTTIYQDVFEVLPGHNLLWRPGQDKKTYPYWELNPVVTYTSKDEAYSCLEEVMIESVRKRMMAADVEVGAFLSGGIDSSLIVSIMCNKLSITPKTFTIGFHDTTFDETKYSRQLAQKFNTDHFEEKIVNWDMDLLFNLIKNHIGQPFNDPSLLPTAKVSELAASHVKVALSGDGADELFSGYQRYQARAIMRWFTRLPAPLRNTALKAIRILPEPTVHHSRSILKKAHLFADIAQKYETDGPYVAPLQFDKDDLSHLIPDIHTRGHRAPNIPEETGHDDIMRMMVADSLIYLPQDILQKVDRASMAYSLETRAPFLDTRVIETAFSIPGRWHRHGLSGKRSLKSAFRNYLPQNIWNRRKQGFSLPVHEWFRSDLGVQLEALLNENDGHLNADFINNLLKEHRSRQRDHGLRLWTIFVYLVWRVH